jgi:3-hydroxybutyrate dehydrogenase
MLQGKTALVTGSTSGIGLGIAKSLASRGANIVLNGFGDIEGPKAAISALGVQVAYHGADMSKPAEIEAMMKFAADKFGRVDILVNNAGIQHVAKIEDFPVDKWDAVLAINLSSAFHATRLALPAMKAANWGRIINIASAHGLVGSAEKSAYVAAKHGLVGLTKVCALETATTGVTCNAICPGWVLTPQAPAAGRKRAFYAIHHPRRAGRVGGVFLLCCRQQRTRRGLEHGWRLGGAIKKTAAQA